MTSVPSGSPASSPRRSWRNPRTLALFAIGLFLVLQIIPPVWFLQNNPPVVAEPVWADAETRALMKRACFDCHSNETVWPLYSRIAPGSWLVTYDVLKGRSELNFSEWGVSGDAGDRAEALEDSIEHIEDGSMPLAVYLPLHPEAQFTAAEKQQLIDGLRRSR